MRPELTNPFSDELLLRRVSSSAQSLYALHEAAQPTGPEIQKLATLCRKTFAEVEEYFLHSFGSVWPDTLAKKLLVDLSLAPRDLSYEELIEMIEQLATGDEFLTEYWVECLSLNTGCDDIWGLIFYPADHFGPSHEPTPAEILEKAYRREQKALPYNQNNEL